MRFSVNFSFSLDGFRNYSLAIPSGLFHNAAECSIVRLMVRTLSILAGALALSACASSTQTQVAPIPAPPMAGAYGPPKPLVGLDAKRLITRFGEPRLDIIDRTVRKLQFLAGGCIVDTYLYTTTRGKEPTVTHVDARWPDGKDADLAACGIS